jgi:hypothetical protein
MSSDTLRRVLWYVLADTAKGDTAAIIRANLPDDGGS